MTAVALLEKAYGSFSPQNFEMMISSLCKDLKVKVRVHGRTARDWVQVEVTGEDESVALRFIDREIGLAPVSVDKVGKFSALQGRVIDADNAVTELRVDVGVFKPRVCDAVIPVQRLQAQLADGRNLPLQRLITLFCLHDFVRLQVKIMSELNAEEGMWEAELSEAQVSLFSDWLRSNVDRLMVLGANRREVEEAVEKSRHFRDVVKVEALGPLEHVVVCKLGTDAVGLMPKLGPYLRFAFLAAFSPRKIKEVVRW